MSNPREDYDRLCQVWRARCHELDAARTRCRTASEQMESARDRILSSLSASDNLMIQPWRCFGVVGVSLVPVIGTITDACKDAVDIARALGQPFTFTFNEVPLTAAPDSDDWSSLVRTYHAALGGER